VDSEVEVSSCGGGGRRKDKEDQHACVEIFNSHVLSESVGLQTDLGAFVLQYRCMTKHFTVVAAAASPPPSL
jgi:hypothetical protein